MHDEAWPVELLVPHRGLALLVDRVLRWDSNSVDCVGRIAAGSPYVRGGLASSLAGIELAAQAAAAHEALLRRRHAGAIEPRTGYLVSVKEARFLVAHLPAGVELMARAQLRAGAPPLAIYEVRVECGDTNCLSAIISTHATARAAG